MYEPGWKRAVSIVLAAGLRGSCPKNAFVLRREAARSMASTRAGSLGDRNTGVRRRIIETMRHGAAAGFLGDRVNEGGVNAHCMNSLRKGRPRRSTTQNNDVRLVANRELSS